jgi:LysM repeat protein
MPLCKVVVRRHAAGILCIGMKNPRSSRLSLSHALLGSALFAAPVFALTSAELDSLRAKADRGNVIAQYNLGLAYADRNEPTYDPAQAYAWLTLASANGTNSKVLGQLTSSLTPEQLAEGKRYLAALNASAVSPIASAASPIVPADEPVAAAAPAASTVNPDQTKLSAELAAAWKENELLKAGLTAQLADANKRIAIAEAALSSKDKEIATLTTRLSDASVAKEAAPAAPVGASAELVSLRTEREQLQATANAAATELAELRASLSRATEEQAALRGKLASAITDISEARRAQTLAESEAASLKAAADRTSAERLALAAQLEAATTDLAAAKEAASAAKAVSPNPLADTVKTLEQERDALASRLADANQRATGAETALAAKDKEIATLQARVTELTAASTPALSETGLSVLKADRDRLAESVKILEQERDALTAQLAAAKAAVPASPAPEVVTAPIPAAPPEPDSTAKLAELEKAKAETDTKLEAALRTFTLQQAEIDRLQKSLASIDEERAATATKLEATTTELNSLRPQASRAETVSAEVETLRAQLAAAQQTVAEKTSALSAANQSLVDARKTIDNATTELVATRDQLRQTQAQSAASAIEAQQLKTRLALVGNLPASTAPSRPGAIQTTTVTLPAPAAAAETPAAPRVHTVASGDSLSRISKQYYGTAGRWNDILQANKDVIRNPDALTLGTKLRIP